MKKSLLTLILALTMSISFSQQVINLTPSDVIQNVLDTLTMQDPVIINLAPGTYNESIFMYELPVTAVNTLTIQSADVNNMAVITDAANNVINIGIGYVNLKHLRIVGDLGSAISISDAPLDNINELVIDSCIIEANNEPAISLEIQSTTEFGYHNLFFTNNEIIGGYKGVYIDDMYSVVSGLTVTNNDIRNQKYVALYIGGCKDIDVSSNNIEMPTNNNPEYQGTCGVYLSNITNSNGAICYVSSNIIQSLNIDSVDYTGIYINSYDTSLYIINNFINIENTNKSVNGIYASYSQSRIFHNTVKLKGENGSAISVESSSEFPKVQNNIFASENIALNCMMAPYDNFNNNCYYAGDSLPFSEEGARYSLSDWQNANTNIDQNSVSLDPMFSTDALFTNINLDNLAPSIPEIEFDINGIARNQPFCDMGAIELMFIDLGADVELCAGDTLTITSPTAYSYLWSTGEITQSIQVTETGTYAVTVQESEFGPIASDSINVIQAPNSVIMGTVSYSGGNFNAGDINVELYIQHQENAFYIEQVASDYITSSSTFMFTDVEPNNYAIRGVLESTNYNGVVTCYYGNTVDWEDATYINVGCGDTLNYNFTMYEIPELSGPCSFSGQVTYVNNNKSTAQITGEPVTGAEIYIAQDPSTEPLANAVTESQGNWEVNGLDEGSGYNIRVDIPGLDLISTYTGISVAAGDTVQNDFNFLVDTTTSGGGIFVDTATAIIVVNDEQIGLTIYPNPTSDFININTEFNNPADIQFTISDITGRTIFTSEKENNFVGDYRNSIDISSFKNGVYILNLRIENTFYIKKIVKE